MIVNAEFQVQADNNSSFTVPIMLKLGLSDVGLQTLALRDGADVIVMGCAGMARHRANLEAELGIPVIDPTQAAVAMSLSAVMCAA